MNQKNILKGISLVLGFMALQACESDFTETGSDIIGGGNFDIESYNVKDIKAYNQAYGAVDGSRLGEVPFGYLDNGLFGATSSDLVVQLANATSTVGDIGENVKVDSVYVYIPYFSQFDKVDDKVNYYKLKNVYGEGSLDLKVYQNNYHLMDVDLTDGSASKYYTDQTAALIDKNKINTQLNTSGLSSQNTNFVFANREIVIYKTDENGNPLKDPNTGDNEIKERLIPGMWLDLDKQYFEKFINDNKTKLSETNGFSELFKGLYFKTEGNGSKGAAGLLDIAKGKIVVIFKVDKKTTGEDGKEETTRERKEITLALSGNTVGTKKFSVNMFSTLMDGTYQSEIANANKVQGDQSLYLKGGQGSLAVIDFLKSNNLEELKALKEKDALLNEAYLTIYVDKERMQGQPIPERLFLYDYDNSIALSDFANDAVSTSQYIKQGYNGIFVKEDKENNKEGYYYKFKITDHIRGLLKSKNDVSPKLALTVANNFAVGGYTNQKLKNEINNEPTNVNVVPAYAVSCPLGVVLHGANTTQDNKKMKLEIFYTKAKK
ncbi:DUF4270 domain-containing protein [Myroides odoratimimus]|uniref:DUF4270 domain-containing protein n=1 Tax=Myroides odoratimimus TaxID=76832 RepID=UPI002574B613|nr:DUF4270 domain-containing protein [Myroides odoratimimus]MDM1396759.1 DUF4270 domain-containing protein [Myroides odoratimimus]